MVYLARNCIFLQLVLLVQIASKEWRRYSLNRKQAFADQKNSNLEWFLSKNRQFYHLRFLGKSSERRSYLILEKKYFLVHLSMIFV